MHGGLKFYRGSASAARSYVEADRSRVDDYYLAEGTGLATRYIASPPRDGRFGSPPTIVSAGGEMDGPAYERWVAGYDLESGRTKGRLRQDAHGLRFVEVVVNGPKTWSLAAALHPQIAVAYDAAQDRAAQEIIGWLVEHTTTRVGPRGRQIQVPVEHLEAAVVRHHTSRAGDPHRHLHLQISSRVFAAGAWRGLHSVGMVDSIEAINGIGHAAVVCDPGFRQALAAHGYALDEVTGEISQLAPYVGDFSARAGQITRNIDRYEAQWRAEHPVEEPGPKLRRAWDRRAWAQARPDKVVPKDGLELQQQWINELREAGFAPPPTATDVNELSPRGTPIARLNRDAAADLIVTRLGSRRSSWNAADIRGEAERIVAVAGVVAAASIRRELVEDLATRTIGRCVPLLTRDHIPEHIRSLTSQRVLDVEADLVARLTTRSEAPGTAVRIDQVVAPHELDLAQRRVVAALLGPGKLVVVEGAAGAGKTTTLAAASELLEMQEQRLIVATPTLKAARVAQEQVGTSAFSAAWLIHQHGFRWDEDGHRSRIQATCDSLARLLPGDVLLIDEAGMLDQDTASALLTIADECRARIVFVGDRHQLPAVGRGGVLDHAARWAPDGAHLELEAVHRFADSDYAALTLLMRSGERSGEVFDALVRRGEIVVHPSDVERLAALTTADGLVIVETREQVSAVNATIRDHRLTTGHVSGECYLTTASGERIGIGDRVTTRRNARDLDVANRDCWTITNIGQDGALTLHGRPGTRHLPSSYAREHVELAYATTVHGAQGDTVDSAHFLVGDATGAAAAYVAMTRGRHSNAAHLVADSLDEARTQWIDTFSRGAADLGPAHAATTADEQISRFGEQPDLSICRRTLGHDRRDRELSPHRPTPPAEGGIGR